MEKLSDNPKVAKRQKVERRIARATVKALLAAGYALTVDNGGDEPEIAKSTDERAVLDAMFATDEEYLFASAPGNPKRSWVRFVYGNDGWDVICDYSTTLEETIGENSEVWKLIDRDEARS